MMNFFIHTLGCKVNSCDSDKLASVLLSDGLLQSKCEYADIVIVNSCAVTSESVRKTRQSINRLKSINSNCFLILTGCAVILKQFFYNKNVDLICKKEHLVYKIREIFNILPGTKKLNFLGNFQKTRAFIEIEDGCENFCSYCIIPFSRGKILSKPLQEIDFECENLFNAGFREIVFTGINLGRYGQDIGLNLIDAIKIANKYFKRIRLSSLEPDILSHKMIDSLANFESLCPSFHLSLQSGSDKILKCMNRKYNSEFYLRLIECIKNKFENVTFTTDIIVGFPGETDEDFENTLKIIKNVGFVKVNVFPFSPRPFTSAQNMKQIDSELKKCRTKEAILFSESVAKKSILNFAGKPFEVLFESKEKESIFSGYSKNYIRVKYKSDENLCGKVKTVIFFPDIS